MKYHKDTIPLKTRETILSDPPIKDGHVGFTTKPFKPVFD